MRRGTCPHVLPRLRLLSLQSSAPAHSEAILSTHASSIVPSPLMLPSRMIAGVLLHVQGFLYLSTKPCSSSPVGREGSAERKGTISVLRGHACYVSRSSDQWVKVHAADTRCWLCCDRWNSSGYRWQVLSRQMQDSAGTTMCALLPPDHRECTNETAPPWGREFKTSALRCWKNNKTVGSLRIFSCRNSLPIGDGEIASAHRNQVTHGSSDKRHPSRQCNIGNMSVC